MIRTLLLALTFCGAGLASVPHPVHAQEAQTAPSVLLAEQAPELHAMLDAMGMYEILAIMGTEGTQGGADLEAQLFPGAGGAAWQAMVRQLHAGDAMVASFEEAFDQEALTPEQIAEIQAFLDTDGGARIIAGEVASRRMFLEEDAVEAARDAFMAAVEAEAPRLDILRRFNEVNGLIERNVSGALNLRFAFYRGLIDGGAFAREVPEELMLAEVWAQEPETREMTVEWLFSFQLNAYAGVSDNDLEAYVALSESEAGRALNAALFEAFDVMLADLSYELGTAAAIFIAGEDT